MTVSAKTIGHLADSHMSSLNHNAEPAHFVPSPIVAAHPTLVSTMFGKWPTSGQELSSSAHEARLAGGGF